MSAVAHEPGGEVRLDRVARARSVSVSPKVASRPLLGDAVTVTFDVGPEVREHLVLDALEGQHLEAGVAEQVHQGSRSALCARCGHR